jgi:hypothetical protein
MINKLLLTLLLLNFHFALAQEPCGTDKQQRDLFERDPEAKRAYLEAEKKLYEANFIKQKEMELLNKSKENEKKILKTNKKRKKIKKLKK